MQDRLIDLLKNGNWPDEEVGLFNIPGKGGVAVVLSDTQPTDGTAGYSKGCIWINLGATAVNAAVYSNIGTSSSCNFDPLT